MDEISAKEFDSLVDKSFLRQQKISEIKDEILKPIEKELAGVERRILQGLQDLDKKKHVSAMGTISRTSRTSVKIPQTPEDKEKLFAWIKEQWGDEGFYAHVSVNSQTLNALYNREYEKAREDGNMDFSIPGVGEPVISYGLMRKRIK